MQLLPLLILPILFSMGNALAFVAGAGSTPPNSFEATVKSEFMRGLAGPENLPETQQTQTPHVDILEVGGGYNFGNLGPFEDLKFRATTAFYRSRAEHLNGSQIYPSDEGWILGGELSAKVFHEPEKLIAIFIRSQNPISMNVEKFVNPKTDRIGFGIQTGIKWNDHFAQESVLYFGSGVKNGGFKQNASLSASLLGVWIVQPPDGFSLRVGPFYEGDIGERSDARYSTQGVRAFRLGVTLGASFPIVQDLNFDVTFTQKFTGAYFRATQDLITTLQWIL